MSDNEDNYDEMDEDDLSSIAPPIFEKNKINNLNINENRD